MSRHFGGLSEPYSSSSSAMASNHRGMNFRQYYHSNNPVHHHYPAMASSLQYHHPQQPAHGFYKREISLDISSGDEMDYVRGHPFTETSESEYMTQENYHPLQSNRRRYYGAKLSKYPLTCPDTSDSENDYSPDRKQRLRPLEMIQEISPVLPNGSDNEDPDLPKPMSRMPTQYAAEFNPKRTSTLLNLHEPNPQPQQKLHQYRRPKTNPHHNGHSTPLYTPINQDAVEGIIPSLFDNQRNRPQKPEYYGLSPMVAMKNSVKGILYLEMSVLENYLTVKIRHATFFDTDQSTVITSFVRVETKPNPNRRHHRYQRNPPECYEYSDTETIKRSNKPEYNETFKFRISRRYNLAAEDYLSIMVFSVSEKPVYEREVFGCMAFSLKSLFDGQYDRPYYGKRLKKDHDDRPEAVSVAKGGYFLMGKKQGSRKHFHESKIRRKKFYDDIGTSSISTCSSISPTKMMGESDWQTPSTTASRREVMSHFAGSDFDFGKSVPSSCYQTPAPTGLPKKRSSLTGATVNGFDANDQSLSSPSTSSSSNSSTRNAMLGARNDYDFSTSNSSSSISGINYHRGKRYTLPSIITSDSNSEISQPISLDPIDYHLLYADDPPLGMAQPRQHRQPRSVDSGMPSTHEEEDEEEDEYDDNENAAGDDGLKFKKMAVREIQHDVRKVGYKIGGMHPSVRRVASFTSPPTKAQVAKAAQQQQREQRRGIWGKTIHYLRNKVDSSSSQASLFPTREEVKSWQEKMENLMDNKFGVELFRQFLIEEYSQENIEFSLKCREYRKLFVNEKKNAKKIARLVKEIDEEYLRPNAPKEVNLEGSVRTATRAAILDKNLKLNENTFSLAQNKIDQLLINDKYQRFLSSPAYQDLLNAVTLGSQSSIQSALPDVPFTDSDGSSTPCQTANEDTPLAPQNRTLRSASAIDNCGQIATIAE